MLLHFFGTGSGFTDSHTNAYFFHNDDLILIDLSMQHISKALDIIRSKKYLNHIYMVITHMHDDHVSGLTLFIQYLYYTMNNRKLKIVIPQELLADVTNELLIKGILPGLYEIIPASQFTDTALTQNPAVNQWLTRCIPTRHAPELKSKCFGYEFNINGQKVLYSGDTNRLTDFLPYTEDADEFYVDCSFNYGGVHLKWSPKLKIQLKQIRNHTKVYLMHIDNRTLAETTDLGTIELATVD